jgi:hypothetical protein
VIKIKRHIIYIEEELKDQLKIQAAKERLKGGIKELVERICKQYLKLKKTEEQVLAFARENANEIED